MVAPITELTEETIEKYWNRKWKPKRPGRLDIVVDVDCERYYPVPKEVEHRKFIPQIPHERDEGIIPFWMSLTYSNGVYEVRRVVLGASSFEATSKVRHPEKDLMRAHDLAWDLIIKSHVLSYPELERIEVLRTFCKY